MTVILFSMPIGLLIIFGLRLLVPLTIFRWPLWGGLLSLAVDAADTNIVKPFGVEIPNYTITDKYLDTYYLTIELIVSLSWFNQLAKNTSIFLYSWRLLGLVLFQFTQVEYFFFIFPNLFENFFIFYVFLTKIRKERRDRMWMTSRRKLVVVLFTLWLLKIPQELVLHVWMIGSPLETFIRWLKSQ